MVCTGLCRGAFRLLQLRVFGFFTPATDLISTATRGLSQKMALNRTVHYLFLFNHFFFASEPGYVCVDGWVRVPFYFCKNRKWNEVMKYESNIYIGTEATS